MNVYAQLVQFLDQLEQQRRAVLNQLPVKGYASTQELFQACTRWIQLERGPFYRNGYREYFENICANLHHPDSQHLALLAKLNNLSPMQLFLLIRLLTVTALGNCLWDNLLETYTDRAQALFSEKHRGCAAIQPTDGLPDAAAFAHQTIFGGVAQIKRGK